MGDYIYPVLFFGLVDILTTVEQQRLLELQADQTTAAEEAEYKALLAKAEIGVPLAARLPIILDGEIIPAHKVGHQTQMNKNINLVGDKFEVSSALNTTTITIESVNEGFAAIVSDLLFLMADISFSRFADKAPAVSFFGDSIVIANGYLVGLSRSVNADSNKEIISLTIARDLLFTTPVGEAPEVAGVAETTESIL